MAAYLEDFAQTENCKKIVLYSGMSRTAAHHFWEKHMKYEKRGIVFKKEIT
ncbi:hypothetical protein [Radiobacillus sp. PE A8.2]|uniref:hypothetical protein n=1 Tax=Radiobacillus sp. PE A8.2 TaxID=3380349 RepID=UPI00388FF9E7